MESFFSPSGPYFNNVVRSVPVGHPGDPCPQQRSASPETKDEASGGNAGCLAWGWKLSALPPHVQGRAPSRVTALRAGAPAPSDKEPTACPDQPEPCECRAGSDTFASSEHLLRLGSWLEFVTSPQRTSTQAGPGSRGFQAGLWEAVTWRREPTGLPVPPLAGETRASHAHSPPPSPH